MQTPRPTSLERATRGFERLAAATLIAAMASVLGGCGQKGPLTLPKPPAGAASSTLPATAPAR